MNSSSPSPRSLADYTSRSLIIPRLRGTMTTAVMQELTEVLHREEVAVPDHLFRNLAALNRELLTGKASDFGATFPQVIVPALPQPRFALGRSAVPLPWRAKWLPPIQLVFLIAGSSKNDLEYQQLVAALIRLGRDRLHLDDLQKAPNGEQMFGFLAQFPLEKLNEPGKVLVPYPAYSPSDRFPLSYPRPSGGDSGQRVLPSLKNVSPREAAPGFVTRRPIDLTTR